MNKMVHASQLAQMELSFEPAKDLSFFVTVCDVYQEHHGRWPGKSSSAQQFLDAGIRGYDGMSLSSAIEDPSPDLANDPAYQELSLRCWRDSGKIELSALHPDYRNSMTAQEVNALLGTARLERSANRYDAAGGRSDRDLHLNVPYSMREEAMKAAGIDSASAAVKKDEATVTIRATDALMAFIDRTGMIYGTEGRLSDNYFLRAYENGYLGTSYQQIIGGRCVANLDPAKLISALEAMYRADPVLGPSHKTPSISPRAPAPVVAATSAPSKKQPPRASLEPELARQVSLLTPQGQSLALPAERLSKYPEIKRMLEKAGGKYRANTQTFVFEDGIDPSEVLDKLLGGEKINYKQEFQFFATSAELARQACLAVGPLEGRRVLEPSAGDGAIADVAREMGADVVTVELWNVNVAKLRAKGYEPVEQDFLTLEPADLGQFDCIVANPPFSKNQDIDHFMHMTKFLMPGGSMSVIMSPGWQASTQAKHTAFRDFLSTQDMDIEPIEAGAFNESGTGVATVRVTVRNFQPTLDAKPGARARRP